MRPAQSSNRGQYRVEVSYTDFAQEVFANVDDPRVYDKKLDHLEESLNSLGELPDDEVFDRYEEHRPDDSQLPEPAVKPRSDNEDRSARMTYLVFETEDELDDAMQDEFLDAVEDALTDVLAEQVVSWYDEEQESLYRDEEFSIALEREETDENYARFVVETDPAPLGDVMSRARSVEQHQ